MMLKKNFYKKIVAISMNHSSITAEKRDGLIVINIQRNDIELSEQLQLPITNASLLLYIDIKYIQTLSKAQQKFKLRAIHQRALQLTKTPEELASQIDTTRWVPTLLGELCYHPIPSGEKPTLYNCGRPKPLPLTHDRVGGAN